MLAWRGRLFGWQPQTTSRCGWSSSAAGFLVLAARRVARRFWSVVAPRPGFPGCPSSVSPSPVRERRSVGCSERRRLAFDSSSRRVSRARRGSQRSDRRSTASRGLRPWPQRGRRPGRSTISNCISSAPEPRSRGRPSASALSPSPSFTWSAPLASARPTAWTLDDFELHLTRARTRLQGGSIRFGLSAPSLDDVALDARVAYRRLLIVGAECAVLFLVFAIVAASTLRSGALSASRRLRRFGARRWQTDLLAAAEAVAIVVPAAAIGWVVGTPARPGLAPATGEPGGPLLRRTTLSATGIGLAALLAGLGALILFATMRSGRVRCR